MGTHLQNARHQESIARDSHVTWLICSVFYLSRCWLKVCNNSNDLHAVDQQQKDTQLWSCWALLLIFIVLFFDFSIFEGRVHPPTPPQTTWSTTWCVWRLCTFPLPSVAVLYKYGRLLGLSVPDMRPYGGLVHIQVVCVVGCWSGCLQNCLVAHGAFCNNSATVRAVPQIILGGTFFFRPLHPQDKHGVRASWLPGHVSALINLPHYGSNMPWPPGQVTPHPPHPLDTLSTKHPPPTGQKSACGPPTPEDTVISGTALMLQQYCSFLNSTARFLTVLLTYQQYCQYLNSRRTAHSQQFDSTTTTIQGWRLLPPKEVESPLEKKPLFAIQLHVDNNQEAHITMQCQQEAEQGPHPCDIKPVSVQCCHWNASISSQ